MKARHAVLVALACGSLLPAATARANGRFPRAQRLLERDGDPARLVLAATYGLLVTHDGGREWRHLCELGFAFSVDDIDPLVELPRDGSMLAKGGRSLNRAPDPFCQFESVLGSTSGQNVADLTLDRSQTSRVLALVMERGDAGSLVNRVYESLDSGASFAVRGAPLPDDAVELGLTLDVAPSDPNRLYVSATGPVENHAFVRSDDGGATFSVTELTLEATEYPYIAGVHPTDAESVYVRTDYWLSNDDGMYRASDRLFYSEDGGETFVEIHGAGGKLLGFALSPDGSEVVIAYGDPVEPSRFVEESALGIYRASTSDHSFTKIFEGSVSCLTWTENGLYVCTSQADRRFALGFSQSVNFDLDTEAPLEPLLDLPSVAGPHDCPSCTTVGACRDLWGDSCAAFGNCEQGAAAVGGSDCAGAGNTGASSGAGGAGAGGSTGTTPRSEPPAEGCGCRTAGRTSGGAALVLLVPWLLRRVRRDAARQTSRHACPRELDTACRLHRG